MFAYQQMGKCYQLMKEYAKAILCFKKQLQLAWHIESLEGEMNAYDNLAIQYYYEGDLEKSKYYNDRMTRGKVEARFSIVRKMSQNHAIKKYKTGGHRRFGHVKNIALGIKKLLSEGDKRKDLSKLEESFAKAELYEFYIFQYLILKIKDELKPIYFKSRMMKGNMQQRKGLSQLAHLALMGNLDRDDRDIDERMNAPIMVLRQGTPISDISGENNVLLLPYYQEVEKKEGGGSSMLTMGSDLNSLSSSNINQNQNTNPHRRSKSSLSTIKESSSINIASIEQQTLPRNKHDNGKGGNLGFDNYGQDDIDLKLHQDIIKVEISKSTRRVFNPNSKYLQQLKYKEEQDNKLEQLQLMMRAQKKEQARLRHQNHTALLSDKDNDEISAQQLNMKEIIQKAEIRRWGKAKETVNLQHLSPNRIGKKQKYFDDVSFISSTVSQFIQESFNLL